MESIQHADFQITSVKPTAYYILLYQPNYLL